MTIAAAVPEPVLLAADPDGAVRIGASRVLLERVVHAYQQGETLEGIVRQFPSLTLADAYGVIAHYLRHRPTVDEYLAERTRQGDEVCARITSVQGDQSGLRDRLAARHPRRDA